MKSLLAASLVFFITACASKEPKASSTDAADDMYTKYKDRIGIATKATFIEELGNAEWCRANDAGGENCRFYRNRGKKWIGEGLDKKSVITYDEVIATFDTEGKLRSFKTNSQR